MAFTPAQQREYRKALVQRGICIRCHRQPSGAGRRVCRACVVQVDWHTRSARQRWRQMPDRCPKCGRAKSIERYRCDACLASERGRVERQRRIRREAGLCQMCGRRIGDRAGRTQCQLCHEASLRAVAIRRAMRG